MPAFSPDFNHITRRVRLDLPQTVPSSYKKALEKLPYTEWLKAHISEVIALKNDKGMALLSGIRSQVGKTQSGIAFITEFCFVSQAAFDYYSQHWLPIMRERITESYPGATSPGSPFHYRFALSDDSVAFDALLEGVTAIENVAAMGTLKAA